MRKFIIIGHMSQVMTERPRNDGRPSRLFYTITAYKAIRLKGGRYLPNLSVEARRNIFQRYSDNGIPAWGIGAPEPNVMLNMILKRLPIPAQIITLKVANYTTYNLSKDKTTIEEGTTNKYTAIVFEKENITAVFTGMGHIIDRSSLSRKKYSLLHK